jgi:hypothetical protein
MLIQTSGPQLFRQVALRTLEQPKYGDHRYQTDDEAAAAAPEASRSPAEQAAGDRTDAQQHERDEAAYGKHRTLLRLYPAAQPA